MYEQMVEFTFDAAHSLRDYPGKCAELHGHTYRVQVFISGQELDAAGMLLDFADAKRCCSEIKSELDHKHINALKAFESRNPTAENLAKHVFERASSLVNTGRARVSRVTVWESSTSAVTYSPL